MIPIEDRVKTKLNLHTPPLTALVLLLTGLSAAAGAFQSDRHDRPVDSNRVVATGRLTGARDLQRVVVWQRSGVAHLGVESSSRRMLWQTESNSESVIDSVRISDLDGDGIPEILSLWRKAKSKFGALKIFHWDAAAKTFLLMQAGDNDEELAGQVQDYDIVSVKARKRIFIFGASVSAGRQLPTSQFELRNNRLVRLYGGPTKVNLESGVEGQALLSPSHPGPIRRGETGTTPYKTTVVVRDAAGKEVAQTETDSEGRFRLKLSPGTYTVGGPQRVGRFLPRAGEETVTVEPGKYARVTLHFDSGMR